MAKDEGEFDVCIYIYSMFLSILHVTPMTLSTITFHQVCFSHDICFILQLLIEPSAGLGVAAVMSDTMKSIDPNLQKIGVILCGGNVDIDNLPW